MLKHINSYALALFSLAQEEKKLESYKKQSKEIIIALEENNEYINLLDNKLINVEKRHEFIMKAFSVKLNKNLLNFFFVLADKLKAKVAIPVLKKLIKLINEEENIDEGVIYSTQTLTSIQISKITKNISKKINKRIILVNKIDKTLLSGIKIVIGDEIIEDSIISRLEQIKHFLLEREEN